jgi:hypothetical protein
VATMTWQCNTNAGYLRYEKHETKCLILARLTPYWATSMRPSSGSALKLSVLKATERATSCAPRCSIGRSPSPECRRSPFGRLLDGLRAALLFPAPAVDRGRLIPLPPLRSDRGRDFFHSPGRVHSYPLLTRPGASCAALLHQREGPRALGARRYPCMGDRL